MCGDGHKIRNANSNKKPAKIGNPGLKHANSGTCNQNSTLDETKDRTLSNSRERVMMKKKQKNYDSKELSENFKIEDFHEYP